MRDGNFFDQNWCPHEQNLQATGIYVNIEITCISKYSNLTVEHITQLILFYTNLEKKIKYIVFLFVNYMYISLAKN